jgi:hypothetical protein
VRFILPVFSLSLKHLKASQANSSSQAGPGNPFPALLLTWSSTRPRDGRNMYSLIHAMSLISHHFHIYTSSIGATLHPVENTFILQHFSSFCLRPVSEADAEKALELLFCVATRSSLNEISPPLSHCLSVISFSHFHSLSFFFSSFCTHTLNTYCIYFCSASCYGGFAVATNTACRTELFEFDISYY